MNLIDEAYEKAKVVVSECSTKNGLFASCDIGHEYYNSVWSRDSNITFLGASLTGEFKEQFKRSLTTLSKYQSKKGQIPNAVDIFDKKRKKQVTYATIDSSLWYIIGHYTYANNYHDTSLLKKYKTNIQNALTWIQCQDAGEDYLPEQQPTSDWQDAFPHKYGHTINTQALYYASLIFLNKKEEAKKVKNQVNKGLYLKHCCLFYKDYYLAYIWKDHNGIREEGTWFDSLGNLLTIVFDLATPEIANRILDYIKKEKIVSPYPIKAIYPPIQKDGKDWQPYFEKVISAPYEYLNAGIWPFIGGFYVAALIKARRFKEAETALKLLAMANKKSSTADWDFNEWLHGKSGIPLGGRFQSWSAGMYIFAYESVKRKKVPIKF